MRAVALARPAVQAKISEGFVPLKVVLTYPPKMKEFPLKDWPALLGVSIGYSFTTGEGYTGCSVVSPDLKAEYGNTGEVQVWALFESIAYREDKFLKMLDRSLAYAKAEKQILADRKLIQRERDQKLAGMRWTMWQEVQAAGRLDGPPPGFKWDHAWELFRMAAEAK